MPNRAVNVLTSTSFNIGSVKQAAIKMLKFCSILEGSRNLFHGTFKKGKIVDKSNRTPNNLTCKLCCLMPSSRGDSQLDK